MNPSLSQTDATKGSAAAQPAFLEHAFNVSHPDYKCPVRKTRSGSPLRHKFKTTSRNLVRTGVFATIMTCVECGGKVRATEDYTVTAGIFAN